MNYISTRGRAPPVTFTDALLAGLAPDGGLYVPDAWPAWSASDHYLTAAAHTLAAFAGADLSGETARALAQAAYASAPAADGRPPLWPAAVAPLTQRGPGAWLLELFHGPSLSFKDVAMQLIARLYDAALAERDERLTVLCATSGDTGGAAAEALKLCDRVDLFILIPDARVSDVQRVFMTSSGADHVHALSVAGDFDDCQALVKRLFADEAFAANARLSAVNSINWARILAQSVYFQVASRALSAPGPVSFAVPTGNFGDAFSGYVAKRMGAPIDRILIAANANDILPRALRTGRYQRAERSRATLSPAMDIQVASNFERALFEALDRDGERVASLYHEFAETGGFDIPGQALEKLREVFPAASVTDDETRAVIHQEWSGQGRLVCPHTAVALHAARGLAADGAGPGPQIVLATAHPAKFPQAVENAAGVRPDLPTHCADLFARSERVIPVPADLAAIKTIIQERSRAWRN